MNTEKNIEKNCFNHRLVNHRIIILVMAALLVFSGGPFLSAWGPNGHRIVAEIAEQNLTPGASRAVKEIIGPFPLATIATWPDFIYSEDNWTYAKNRHFMTVPDDQTLDQVLEELKKDDKVDNVFEAIEFFAGILGGDKDKRSRFKDNVDKHGAALYRGSVEASALAFLVHFTGDIHQPMHVGRGTDKGGNRVKVTWFYRSTKLHTLWDSQLLENEQLSYSDYVRFINHASAEDIREYQAADLKQWAQESVDLRKKIYTDLGIGGKVAKGKAAKYDLKKLGYTYSHDYIGPMNQRLLKSGIRLAGLLNSIFK